MKSLFLAAADLETIITRQQDRLDWGYIFEQLESLCEPAGTSDITDHVRRLKVTLQEERHRQGYEQKPPADGEFDTWENEQAWPNS